LRAADLPNEPSSFLVLYRGLRLHNALEGPSNFSIELVMEYYSLASHWKKLIDFSNLTSDFNLYVAGDEFALSSADFLMVLTRQINSPRG